ncbi:hypothetical protein GCM10011390_12390 [Aureimonas endophytica]|uniref:Outer membrane lipoprotein n=1 Tax=Aureimonas endophytica TaxID=2027858 RepID=A0A916ZGZ5_9HYPH|nr:hypothetical protein [Aureimonas endophytica]GGD95178.1 hypothetical protein GCM10011390_12390 [Aureimonas endophytica]
MSRKTIVALLSALAAFAGCASTQQTAAVAPPPAPRGIEGSWASTGGAVAYNANFTNGTFTSTESGTGAVLAEGTYRPLGPGQVTIEYTSRVRGTRIAANCNQVEPDRLACASSNGSRFEFTRRG